MYSNEEALANSLEYFEGDELAASVIVSKYLLRDEDGELVEGIPSELLQRIASEFARAEDMFPNALSEEEIFAAIDRFQGILPQGSPLYGIGNNYKHISLSNCVVAPAPEDDMSSIMETGKTLANLFKRRCGVGTDLTNLRPENAVVSNSAGFSTGAWSFADYFSQVCLMVAQKGRRGALMLTLDVRHPDAIKFATSKHDKTKVTGANISLKITDDFMNAVINDETYTHHWPVGSPNPSFTTELAARETWNQIVESATQTADPGLMMWDNILRTLPAQCYADVGFDHVTTNPCGELPLSALDSCRLIAILLSIFVKNPYTDQAYFDYDEFARYVRMAQRLSDDLVELELEKLRGIISKVDTPDEKALWTKMLEAARKGRRTGLGTTGLADALSRLQVRYGSPESLVIVDKIYEALKINAYDESVNLAIERGAFEVFDWQKEKDNEFIQGLPVWLQTRISKHGRRNISILTNAPTGSISILARSSSGIEPVFRLAFLRRKKINPSDPNVRVDFVDETGISWQHFEVVHPEVDLYRQVNGQVAVDDLPEYFVTSDQIDWRDRIALQAVIQRHIDHSISSTINLPRGTTPDLVSELYIEAWKAGLKGVTIYVEGSKSGVLVSKEEQTKEVRTEDAPKRPDELPCTVHHEGVKGEEWVILVGTLNNVPYEVFAAPRSVLDIPQDITHGIVHKHTNKTVPSRYVFKSNGTTINLGKALKEVLDYGTLSRMVSMSLRHGVPIHFVVDQLQKDPNTDLWSFNRVLARTLKTWIPDGTKRDKQCPECQAPSLVYQEGCLTCTSCGYAKCG